MNLHDERLHDEPHRELMIQRCVDGEATDEERAALLSHLEVSGEWRALALGFVENQVLSAAIADFGSEPEDWPPKAALRKEPAGLPSRRAARLLPITASLLVGVLFGIVAHHRLARPVGEVPGPMNEALARATAAGESGGSGGVDRPAETADAASVIPGPTPLMNVNLAGLVEGMTEPVSLPVYAPEHYQALKPLDQAVFPEDVRERLESLGFVVDRERQLYRAALEDGREVVFPTETMRVRYAVQ